MPHEAARQAFEALLAALPSGAYAIRSNYRNVEKMELHRSFGTPQVVLVWSANGLANELTTRTEYVTKIGKWFPGFMKETSKPQYSRTFSVTAIQLEEIITKDKVDIAAAILSVDESR